MLYGLQAADCLDWLRALPADCADLVFFSPPYEDCRTYGPLKFSLKGQAWVTWMVEVFEECRRVCKGLVACVCEGKTRGYRWSAVPALLMADLHRAGFVLRKPPIFYRKGIFGGGGKAAQHAAAGGSADWLGNNWEPIICTTRGGKLPWADALATGKPPKFGPGGQPSHRLTNGQRVNRQLVKTGCIRGMANGDTKQNGVYKPPKIANPGNVIRCKVGGGLMGHQLAHKNEAPFPLTLAEFFVRSFCPPGGLVVDPFLGSGTTGHACILHGRRFVGCDVREDQIEIARKRLESITPCASNGSQADAATAKTCTGPRPRRQSARTRK